MDTTVVDSHSAVTGVLPYDPRTQPRLSFSAATKAFRDGYDTPRAFLERCLATFERREPEVRAFVFTNLSGARAAADAATARYRAGRPLSPMDGLPLGIKDVFETEDMPTEMNSPAFVGYRTGRDAAHVYALRHAGALIVGKTVTTEFAQGASGATRNPFDTSRTPGGSSSGSAAAVGAGMVPVATGSQARGSIIRPASYCANYALKPSFGALNSQGTLGLGAPSQCVVGIHAATLQDCWNTACYIGSAAGGDPGCPGLDGEMDLGSGRKLERVIRLDTLGWEETDLEIREKLELFLRQLERLGVTVLGRRDDSRIEDFERALRRIPEFMWPILLWEMRWPGWLARDRGAHLISDIVLDRLKRAEAMSIDEYRQAIVRRQALHRSFLALADLADAAVTLCSPGPAPIGTSVGNPVFADISSNLLCPSFALPLLEVEGLPLGIQLLGYPNQDFKLAQHAHWLSIAYLGQCSDM
ncbi:MAG TPA: amidase [Xanthobacteraceae bacterium]|jgi:Asp-tRNA(Asn)/Glu-tRNA(Gln) amidotransferase A subunit family amidase